MIYIYIDHQAPAEAASSLVREMEGEAIESMSSSTRLKKGWRSAFCALGRADEGFGFFETVRF